MDNKEFNEYLTDSNLSLIENIPKWRSDFINFGGFDHLI